MVAEKKCGFGVRISAFAWLLTSVVSGQTLLVDQLKDNRYELDLNAGELTGSGAHILTTALVASQFVLIGEDHGISEIPRFVSAVCRVLGPAGFHTFAVEAGPLAAGQLSKWVGQQDGKASLLDFEKKFPLSIAFFDIADENQLLSDCAKAFDPEKFQLWGLDQEFIGSAGLILTRILETKPGPAVRSNVEALLKEETTARAQATKTKKPGDLFLFTVPDSELSTLEGLLKVEGNPLAQSLFQELKASHQIYNNNGSGYAYYHRRALLMKTTFNSYLKGGFQKGEIEPKVLFKFGELHLYRGLNPGGNNEIGSFISELAEGQGKTALHICVIGVKGSQLQFGDRTVSFNYSEDKDAGLLFLKPMFDNLEPHGFSLFDLRGLRNKFSSLQPVDRELERLIFGYDLLVVIPQVTPSKPMH